MTANLREKATAGAAEVEAAAIEVMDRVILGVMAELDWMSEDTDDANVDGTGWMIGPYLSAEIADGVFLEIHPDPEHALSDREMPPARAW